MEVIAQQFPSPNKLKMYSLTPNPLYSNASIAFPCEKYAHAALNSLAVDPPFTDSKTKKTTITREMKVRQIDGGIAYLDVEFESDEDEVNSLRTCISSFVANASLICETMKEFGN